MHKTKLKLIIVLIALCGMLLIAYLLLQGTQFDPVGQTRDDSIKTDPTLTLTVGETAETNGLRVTFNAMLADMRCVPEAPCDTEGLARVSVTTEESDRAETFELNSAGEPRPIGAYELTLLSVAPELGSDAFINPNEYVIGLSIERVK